MNDAKEKAIVQDILNQYIENGIKDNLGLRRRDFQNIISNFTELSLKNQQLMLKSNPELLATCQNLSQTIQENLCNVRIPGPKEGVFGQGYHQTSSRERTIQVQKQLAINTSISVETQTLLLQKHNIAVNTYLAKNLNLAPRIQMMLAENYWREVLSALATNQHLIVPAQIILLKRLKCTDDDRVMINLAANPCLATKTAMVLYYRSAQSKRVLLMNNPNIYTYISKLESKLLTKMNINFTELSIKKETMMQKIINSKQAQNILVNL